MILNITKLAIFVLFFSSQVLYAYQTIVHEPEVSASELKRDGSKYIGKDVSITGFLMVDEGMYLYLDLNSFIQYDVRSSVYFTISNYGKYKSLSGCFVALVGTVGTHKTDNDVFLISNIKSITRTGSLYQIAQERGKNDLKCEIDAIVDAM